MTNIFDDIAPEYDFMNNIISLFLHKSVKKLAASEIIGDKILDLCTGTGDVAGIIKKTHPEIDVCGADLSDEMLKIAKVKHPEISFIQTNASKMPFGDNFFTSVISAYGFRNIEDKTAAIKEIKRVLAPSGVFVHLDFGEKSELYDFFVKLSALFFAKNKNAYNYLINSKNNFENPASAFQNAGFELIKEKFAAFNMARIQVFQKM